MLVKLIRWLIFGAVGALLPLVATWALLAFRHQDASLAKIIGNGELLVAIWVLSFAALGEMFGADAEDGVLRMIAIGAALLVIISAVVLFIAVIGLTPEDRVNNEADTVVWSVRLYLASLLSQVFCLLLSES